MRLGELFASAGLMCPAEHEDIEFTGVVTDSRLVTKGSIFVAVRGQNNDGHDHISQAVINGAVVIVAERVRDECVGGAAIILVENTGRVAALLYNAHCKHPSKDIKLIGVTGTNGKTSVCMMLESIFLEAGRRCAVIGTLGCRVLGEKSELFRSGLTTPPASELCPLLASLRDQGIEYVFMEVSSHAMCTHRVDGLCFEAGVFTNLTRDHLDFHGSMENYFLAKASLFAKCKKIFINTDDKYGKRLKELYRGSFALSQKCGDITAKDIECTFEGCSYTLEYKNEEYDIKFGALGDFSVSNSLCAAAVALELGISPVAVSRGLSRFKGAQGRMQRVTPEGADFELIVDFAHTPDALEHLLRSVRALRGGTGRIITLFGCGGDRDRGKRKEMGRIASKLSDICIVTSDNPRSEMPESIIADILKGINKEKEYKVIPDRKAAIAYALESARKGDIALFCGKGHEKYQIDNSGVHEFDEARIISDLMKKRLTKITERR